MQGFLSSNKIDYVLFHIGQHLELSSEIRERIIFLKRDRKIPSKGRIIFQLSESSFNINNVKTLEGIPILFPLGNKKEFYKIEDGSLIFHDDLLKSAFYLLSGYQELNAKYRDRYDRFPYELSVQHKLDKCQIPIVNYYFEKIYRGIEEFCQFHSIPFNRIQLFNNFGFFLSHDIDKVDTYTFKEVIFILKQAFGLSRRTLPLGRTWKHAFHYLINYLNFFNRKNPHWDFNYHLELEKKYSFKSTYFFLSGGTRNQDALYSFSEARIVNLFKILSDEDMEIGLHGSYNTPDNLDLFVKEKKYLEKYAGLKISGNRQHALRFFMDRTPQIYENAGIMFDSTLGFAEHEGFRNGYCHPFRLYDHENDRMIETIEIPLSVMDVTLFMYRKLSMADAMKEMDNLLEEIVKFGGVFSLLWHNGNFDEIQFPGIRKFYEKLLGKVSALNADSFTGSDLVRRVNESRKEAS